MQFGTPSPFRSAQQPVCPTAAPDKQTPEVQWGTPDELFRSPFTEPETRMQTQEHETRVRIPFPKEGRKGRPRTRPVKEPKKKNTPTTNAPNPNNVQEDMSRGLKDTMVNQEYATNFLKSQCCKAGMHAYPTCCTLRLASFQLFLLR